MASGPTAAFAPGATTMLFSPARFDHDERDPGRPVRAPHGLRAHAGRRAAVDADHEVRIERAGDGDVEWALERHGSSRSVAGPLHIRPAHRCRTMVRSGSPTPSERMS